MSQTANHDKFIQARHYFKGVKDSAGFTLIEVLITLSVFTIGVIGSFALAIANLRSVEENQDRLVVSNLAREGIEMVKNTRDSNWLKIQANEDCDSLTVGLQLCDWDQGLASGYYIVDPINYPQPQCTCADITSCAPIAGDTGTCGTNPLGNGWINNWSEDKRIYIGNTDPWLTNYTNGIAAQPTNIFRMIEIRAVCMNDTTLAETVKDTCVVGETKVAVEVTAHMRWRKFGNNRKMDIVSRLYNWRR